MFIKHLFNRWMNVDGLSGWMGPFFGVSKSYTEIILSWAWWHMSVFPGTGKTEAGGSFEPNKWRPAKAT
jgi:hypothetical protein